LNSTELGGSDSYKIDDTESKNRISKSPFG
jgi:hypothetical protein